MPRVYNIVLMFSNLLLNINTPSHTTLREWDWPWSAVTAVKNTALRNRFVTRSAENAWSVNDLHSALYSKRVMHCLWRWVIFKFRTSNKAGIIVFYCDFMKCVRFKWISLSILVQTVWEVKWYRRIQRTCVLFILSTRR